MNTLSTLLEAVFGMAIVIGIWYTLQGVIRKRRGSDQDALDGMCHGCGGCKNAGSCHTGADASNEEHHHELV
jgi:hypothetical protein